MTTADAFDDLLTIQLWATLVAFERALADELQPMGLSVAAFRLVGEVMKAPEGLRQGELADRLAIRPPSVSAAVDRLVDAGVVERVPDPDDARARRVRIAEGASLQMGAEALMRLETRLLDGLDVDDIHQTKNTLRQLLQRLQETSP